MPVSLIVLPANQSREKSNLADNERLAKVLVRDWTQQKALNLPLPPIRNSSSLLGSLEKKTLKCSRSERIAYYPWIQKFIAGNEVNEVPDDKAQKLC